jgi:hypothetical protein
MFAPNPLSADTELVGLILMRDGSTVMWRNRDLNSLSRWQQFLQTRHRKWQMNLALSRSEPLHISFCECLLRKYRQADYDPVRIELGVEIRKVPQPDTPEEIPEMERNLVFVYDPENLFGGDVEENSKQNKQPAA